MKICVLCCCSCAGPIEVKGKEDPIFQGTSILGSMDYRPSTPRNHDITFGVPQHHAQGTMTHVLGSTGGGTNATLSQGNFMEEPSEGTLFKCSHNKR